MSAYMFHLFLEMGYLAAWSSWWYRMSTHCTSNSKRTVSRLIWNLRIKAGGTARCTSVIRMATAFASYMAVDNKSLDASGTSGLVSDNLSVTQLSAAASTQPLAALMGATR